MFAFAMGSSHPRPPPPPIPTNTTAPTDTGTATSSSAPAAKLETDSSGAGGTGQKVIHFTKSILETFRTKRWADFYLNTYDVRADAVHCEVGAGAPAKCDVSAFEHVDPRVHTTMFNPFCFGKPTQGFLQKSLMRSLVGKMRIVSRSPTLRTS